MRGYAHCIEEWLSADLGKVMYAVTILQRYEGRFRNESGERKPKHFQNMKMYPKMDDDRYTGHDIVQERHNKSGR